MHSSKIKPLNQSNFELERIETQGTNDKQRIEDESLNGKFTKYLVFSLLIAAIGSAFQFGWCLAVLNTPVDIIQGFYREVYLERNGKPMTDTTLETLWSITNGLIPVGGVIGGLSSGAAADYFGRKNGLILVNVFVIISGILNIVSKFIRSYETLMISRFFNGVYCGFFTGLLPLYLSECSPKNLRGTVGTLNQLLIVTGILIANILGLPELLGTQKLWPVLVGFCLIPALAHIGLFFTPESPKYLFINKNDRQKAKEAFLKLRNNDIRLVEKEMEELEQEVEKNSKLSQVKWTDFYKNRILRRAIVVTIMIQVCQQLSGINAVIFYSTRIFANAGLTGSWPIYGTIILGVVQIIMTIICMLIVDRAGRRILLLSGMIGMCIFSFILAITRIFGKEGSWLNYMTVVAAILYIVFFSIGPGAIPWLITSELFDSSSRGKATSIAVFINWFSNFLVTVTFPFVEVAIGSYSFIIFGVLLILFSLAMLFFVPETKNKPIEEILEMFDKKYIFFPKGN